MTTKEGPDQVIYVPRSELKLHANLRKEIDKRELDELKASIKEKGILQPLLCRKNGHGYEVIAGQRRFLASEGIDKIPIMIKTITDDEITELQLTENIQRANVTPMDEARAYAFFVKKKETPAAVAKRLGKSLTYVALRMELNKLNEYFVKHFENKAFTIQVAFEIARLPKTSQEVLQKQWKPGNGNLRQAIEGLLLNLDTAPFDITDETLIPALGSCVKCEYNSANKNELFPDASGLRICTNAKNYESKVKANFDRHVKLSQTDPAYILLCDSHRADEAAVAFGKKHSVTIYTDEMVEVRYPDTPRIGNFDDDVKGYNKAVDAYKKEIADNEKKVENGQMLKGLIISGRRAGSIRYVTIVKKSKGVEKDAKKDADAGYVSPETLGAEINRIKSVEIRKTELDYEKVSQKIYDAIKEKMKTPCTLPLSKQEKAGLLIFLTEKGNDFENAMKKTGYNPPKLSKDEIGYAMKASDKTFNAVVRTVFLKEYQKQYDMREGDIGSYIMRASAEAIGVDVKAIDKEFADDTAKRRERVNERIGKLKSQLKELPVKKKVVKKK